MFTIFRKSFVSSAGPLSSISTLPRGSHTNSIKSASAPEQIGKSLAGDVLLVGTVHSDLTTLSGRKQFFLKTQENKVNYVVHNVFVAEQKLEILGTPIVKGLNLLVTGWLRAPTFKQPNGKERCTFRINAKSIYSYQTYVSDGIVLEDDDEDSSAVTSMDRNHIRITANIATDIQQNDSYSSFGLMYKYPRPDGEMEAALVTVFAHGDYLSGYVRQRLDRRDRVTVSGQLKYKIAMDDKGKKKHCGYILAKVISKNVPLSYGMQQEII